MIEWIIRRSVANRFLVMMGALFLSIWGDVDHRPYAGGCPAGSL
ncbi:Cation efflux system protein CusA [Raoultella terrigena]|nr:Cation efflux system protein CusA [Raoultella terrigena]